MKTKFVDENELKAAVREHAAAEWLKLTGTAWGYHHRACFIDRDLPEHELIAILVSQKLLETLREVAVFAADYQREPSNQTVKGPDGACHKASETYRTRQLLRVVEEHLPDLDPRIEDGTGKKIATAEGPRPMRPGWFAFLSEAPGGWTSAPRQRIVVLLRDHLDYWETLGLSEPADNRTMALASILAGNWPDARATNHSGRLTAGVKRKKEREGRTVGDVMKAETAAIRAAVDKLRRSPATEDHPRFRKALNMPPSSAAKKGRSTPTT